MPIDEEKLRELDAENPTPLMAIAATRNDPTGTLSKAIPFVCNDGKTYWLKRDSQHGLGSELIAGRLAADIFAGPACRVVQLPSAAISAGVHASHLEGTVFGSESVPNSENSKDLSRFLSSGTFSPSVVDERSRALTIVFQTWVGVGDQQLLVRFDDGRVYSIDHGNCFGNLDDRVPSVVVAGIPGLDVNFGKNERLVDEAVGTIERLSEDNVLEAISCIPDEPGWQASFDRRVRIGNWLLSRKDQLREAMESWLK